MRLRIFIQWSLILTSCTTTKTTESTIQNYNENSIYFLVFKISKDSLEEKSSIELVSTTKTIGKFKNDNLDHIDSDNFLTFELFEKDQLVKTIVLEHPLYKNVEYVEGNTFATKSIELNTEEFFVRIQMKGNSNKIKVSETLKDSIKKELLSIKL
jgi:hypothetical protein